MKRILFIVAILLSVGFLFAACNNEKSSQLAADEVYSCTMHSQVLKEKPGQCPICGMDLVKRKATTAELEKRQKEANR